MGSVRGRALLDLVRHRFGWTARGGFDTKQFWEHTYGKSGGVLPHEWALPPAALLKYAFADASPHRQTTRGRATTSLEVDCPLSMKTLVLGGGTSALAQMLKDAGWADVAALDFSEVAVSRGKEVEPDVNWSLGDARTLDEVYDEGSFGSVVDKGTIDAIYLSADAEYAADVGKVAAGVARLLQPRGAFLVVSLSAPEYMWPLLQNGAWDVTQSEVRRLDGAFLYVLRRGRRPRGASVASGFMPVGVADAGRIPPRGRYMI